MTALILGLILFLGVHSTRIVAEDWRSARRAAMGENAWKMGYTVISLIGFGLIIWGFGQARQDALVLWATPRGMNHLAALLMLPSLVLLVAAKVPNNHLKVWLGHPMLLGVKTWALAHLLANNTLPELLLFGGFLVWAVLCFRAARQRDRLNPPAAITPSTGATVLTVLAGGAVWALFAFWAHAVLIGVRPLG